MVWQALVKAVAKKVVQQVASKAGEKASNTGALGSIKQQAMENTPDSVKRLLGSVQKVATVASVGSAVKGGYNAVKNGGMGGTAYAGEISPDNTGEVKSPVEIPSEIQSDEPSMASKIGGGTLAVMGSAVKSSSPVLGGMFDAYQKRADRIAAEGTLLKGAHLAEQNGMSPEGVTLLSGQKPKTAAEAATALKSMSDFIRENTQKGIADNIKNLAKQAAETKKAQLDPEVVQLELDKRRQEKEQDIGFKAQEQFLDIQKNLLQKGVDLDATEKQKLVFAKQGEMAVKKASDFLNDINFNRAVFQSAGGKIGKLSSFGDTKLRNYNTAIGSAVQAFVYANTGAQASDKERDAYQNIYGLQIGDTPENAKFKNEMLGSLFKTAQEVIDPNKVSGLTVTELNGKFNEITNQLKMLKGGDSKDAKIIVDGLKKKALSMESEQPTESKMPSRGDAPKGSKGWSKTKGWVF